jgi:alpha-tubulin suppressor-like RCC1 family protein
MSRPNQFLSPEGDLEDYFVDEYWLIDQYVGDALWIWGRNDNTSSQRLGNNISVTVDISTPITTFAGGTNWKQVSAGYGHVAAIKTDGTLWTWGGGGQGQLGINANVNRSTPVTTFAGGTNWKQVACGRDHVAAIKTDGTLWTWGSGNGGELGTGGFNNNSSVPRTVFGLENNWKQVSCGYRYTAAIKTNGTLWTWGNCENGKLGNALTTGIISTPVTTFAGGTNWKQVSLGIRVSAAIKTDGTLWTWGYGLFNGQLGNGGTSNVSTPITTFAGGTNWKQVSHGQFHLSAIKTDGTLWTWGVGSAGDLGNATLNGSSTPITTFAGGTNWKQVAGGRRGSIAVKTDGTLWVWGIGSNGILGNAVTTGNISTPITTFAGGTNWKQVAGAGGPGGIINIAVQAGMNAEYPLS